MSERIRIYTTGTRTRDWRAEFAENGTYVCDIRLSISSTLNGSHYYVLHEGTLIKEGTFDFGVWDTSAAREVVEAILRSMYPHASVSAEAPVQPDRAAGT